MPRNTQLNEKVEQLKLEAKEFGFSLDVEKTIDSDSYILSNKKEFRAIIIGRVDINGVDVISTFTINVYKWRWAEAEGFTKEQMIEEMGSEIFSSIDLKYVSRYLSGEDIM